MLVNRRTFTVNKPHFEEALELLGELRHLTTHVKPDAVFRIYASEYGPFDTIAYEYETESLTTLEQELNSMMDTLDAGRVAAWFKRWNEVTATGGMNEIWRLVE